MSTRRTFLGWLAALVAAPVPSLTPPAAVTGSLISIEYDDGTWTVIAELRGDIPITAWASPRTVEVPYRDTIEWVQ